MMLKQFLDTALDWVFPPQCSGCGRVGWAWCPHCADDLRAVPLKLDLALLTGFEVVMSTGIHTGKLAEAVRALKYDRVLQVKTDLGERLAKALWQKGWQFDILIPVPLHSKRFQQRGYNQAKHLCDAIAAHSPCSILTDVLFRARDTPPQVGLNHQERIANMHGAFRADARRIADKVVLLVDDVRTTGATLSACAHALHEARAVYGITVTQAAKKNPK